MKLIEVGKDKLVDIKSSKKDKVRVFILKLEEKLNTEYNLLLLEDQALP